MTMSECLAYFGLPFCLATRRCMNLEPSFLLIGVDDLLKATTRCE